MFSNGVLIFFVLQFFTHPVIDNLKNDKWYGDIGRIWTPSYLSVGRWKWMFLDLWCLFDLVLFPAVFTVLYFIHVVKGKSKKQAGKLLSASPCCSFHCEQSQTTENPRELVLICYKNLQVENKISASVVVEIY